MVLIALVYSSGDWNMLINDWYECFHVLSKLPYVWNAYYILKFTGLKDSYIIMAGF